MYRTHQTNKLKLYFYLFVVTFYTFSFNVRPTIADTEDCIVGDTLKGNWLLIEGHGKCLIPGAHAEDSLWPSESARYNSAHTIWGRTRIVAHLYGTPGAVPSEYADNKCISHFSEARAKAECAYWEYITSRTNTGWRYEYNAEGSTCTTIAIWELTGERVISSMTFYEVYYDIYEWRCWSVETFDNEKNMAGFCPIR